MNISRGKIKKAQKVVIYGPEGIGKSTLASQFPDPLFIDTEGSTAHLDVARMDPPPRSWEALTGAVVEVSKTPGICKTLVIDTADWAETLCINQVLAANEKKGIEDFAYGKGYVYVGESFGKLLNSLNDVIGIGINVVLTAHAKMRKFEQPDELGAYDRWEMKLSKQVAPMLKEWPDMVLFANYKTISVAVDKDGKHHKAQGGKRVMHTSHHPCWDAKNRHGLPDELPLDYKAIAHCFDITAQTASVATTPTETETAPAPVAEKKPPTPSPATPQPTPPPRSSDIPPELDELLIRDDIAEQEVRAVIASKGYFPVSTPWSVMASEGFVAGWVLPFWGKIVEIIRANPNRLPF